jgi:aldose 1-epimerase
MAFAVFTRETNGFEQIILEDKATHTRVIILPQHGGLLHAFMLRAGDEEINIFDHYEDIGTLETEIATSFKGAKLSPFPCRIVDGTYEIDGKRYQFGKTAGNGSTIHGLLFNKPFREVGHFCDDYQASVQLKYNYKKDDAGYPFDYRCEIVYTLFPENILQVQTTILNLDSSLIPVADGWHPYFRLGGKIDNWMLRFDSDCLVELGENLVPTGRMLPDTSFQTERTIGERSFDHCFLLKNKTNYAACTLFNPANSISVSFFPDQSYPYLLIYTPPHRESIAIENLSAPPDSFNNRMGLLMLPPGHSKTFSIYYKIDRE